MRQQALPSTIFFLRTSSTQYPLPISAIDELFGYYNAMNQTEEFDDCFSIELPIIKVQHIFFLSQQTLLLIHIPKQFTIVNILSRSQTQVVRRGNFPHAIMEDIRPFDNKSVLYVHQNKLVLFHLLLDKEPQIYSISKSDIYEQRFQFSVSPGCDRRVVFYKTSVLKSTPVTVYYDIHLLVIHQDFERIKKFKLEHQDLRQFALSCGEIVSYQTRGYDVEINFIESNISHKINSIFHLFLVQVRTSQTDLVLSFTHEELEQEVSAYTANKHRVKKLERREKKFESHVYRNDNGLRSIVYKNFLNHRSRDHFQGIFRIIATKQSKYLKMLDHLLPSSTGKQFIQEVLDLLG